MSIWDYRILVFGDTDKITYSLRAVNYTDDKQPYSYRSCYYNLKFNEDEIDCIVDMMKKAIDKPFLYGGVKFPKEFNKEEYYANRKKDF